MRRITLPILGLLALLWSPSTWAGWSSDNLPNPNRVDGRFGFTACRMAAPALLCDPDATLTDQQREALNHQLLQFRNATADPNADSECKRKGTTPAIAILDDVDADMMNQQNMSMLAVYAHSRWQPDLECHKSFVIVLPTRNWRLISRDYHYEAPIFYDEFTFYFFREHEAFERGEFFTALTNIVAGLQNAVNLKRQLVGSRLIAEALDEYVASAPAAYRQLAAHRIPLSATGGPIDMALAYLRDPAFLLAVLAVAFVVYAFVKLLEAILSRIWPRWTKTRAYRPVENEKKNSMPHLSTSRLASPVSQRVPPVTVLANGSGNDCGNVDSKPVGDRVSLSTFTPTSPAPSPPPPTIVL